MGFISWFGQFGSGAPPINNDRLPFWWDMLVVAGFSLIIYYWAMYSKLPRRDVQHLVELQSARMGDVPATPRH